MRSSDEGDEQVAQMTKTLLVVHHTPSPHCQEMFEAVLAGANDPEIEGVEVVRRPALTVKFFKIFHWSCAKNPY